MIHRLAAALLGLAILSAAAVQACAAQTAGAQPTVERIKVHGPSLEGNLEGNSADREVLVVLPPSYATAKGRRYPVVYFLHGFTSTAQGFSDFLKVPDGVAASAAKGAEFIVVMPDSYTRHGGSMYSSSPTTGDFETFIARDLVAYVDAHYRTLAKRESRGLAGHSMGGYGVWKIGMKYPQLWSSLYAMSACCITPRTETVEVAKRIAGLTLEEAVKADFGTRAAIASAVAWSPATDKPPFYVDFAYRDGAVDPVVLARWAANSPLAMTPQYLPALKSMKAIAMDVGDKDFLLGDDMQIHKAFDRFGIAHQWEVYDGDHVNRIADRFEQKVLPFFAQNLAAK